MATASGSVIAKVGLVSHSSIISAFVPDSRAPPNPLLATDPPAIHMFPFIHIYYLSAWRWDGPEHAPASGQREHLLSMLRNTHNSEKRHRSQRFGLSDQLMRSGSLTRRWNGRSRLSRTRAMPAGKRTTPNSQHGQFYLGLGFETCGRRRRPQEGKIKPSVKQASEIRTRGDALCDKSWN